MREEPTLILTVGLPRSGKSTWAMGQGHPVVNPDSIRLALHGRAFLAQAEPMVWGIAQVMVRALFVAGHKTVILDATNIKAADRAKWMDRDWRTVAKLFDAPPDVCVRRAYASGREDLVQVIHGMSGRFEMPVELTLV